MPHPLQGNMNAPDLRWWASRESRKAWGQEPWDPSRGYENQL